MPVKYEMSENLKMELREGIQNINGNSTMSSDSIPRLFIGGMNLDTGDDALKQYFAQFGTLTEARVTKHEHSGESKGYGFVTFSDDAELDACQRARPHFIEGASISTFRFVSKEEDKKNMSFMDAPRGHCKKLYVSELESSVKEDDLNCYFGQYGNIIDIELKVGNTQPDGKWKGNFAFIEFDDYDPVDKCIMDGTHELEGNKIVVRRALSKHGKDHERKIFVGPLNDDLTDEMLYNYFLSYGKVFRIERPLDRASKKRRDFAFIEFQSMDPVLKIVERETHDIEGHEVRVKKVGPKDWTRDSKSNAKNMGMNGAFGMGQWNPAAFGSMGMIDPRAFAMNGDPRAMAMTVDPRAMAMNGDPRAFAMNGDPRALTMRGFGGMQGASIGRFNARSMNPFQAAASYGRGASGPMKAMRGQDRYNPYGASSQSEVDIPEQLLMRYFSNFGNVIKIDRPFDSKNLRKRDYAFVEFDDPNSVRMCLCTTHQIMGKEILVRQGNSKDLNMDRKIFVDLKGKSKPA